MSHLHDIGWAIHRALVVLTLAVTLAVCAVAVLGWDHQSWTEEEDPRGWVVYFPDCKTEDSARCYIAFVG